jgi:hypothetical protein
MTSIQIPLDQTALESICSEFDSISGGGTSFWIESLTGTVVVEAGGRRRGRVARSALLLNQQVAYAVCASGPAANSLVPFFARACQRELQHACAEARGSEAATAGGGVHDLSNVMATILGNAELLDSAIVPDAPEHRFVERILAACNLGLKQLERLGGRSAQEPETGYSGRVR